MRGRIVAANWKMNLLSAEAAGNVRRVRAGLAELDTRPAERTRVVIFPSFPLIPAVAGELAGIGTGIGIGGQDLHPEDKGAHTGDVSGAQLADAGCTWALCGHSERRQNHGEDDGLVARKVAAALRHGLAPMVCVGETRDERLAGRTFEVLERQARAVFGGGRRSRPGMPGTRRSPTSRSGRSAPARRRRPRPPRRPTASFAACSVISSGRSGRRPFPSSMEGRPRPTAPPA